MSATEFWDGDPALVKAYRKADAIRRERINEEAWLNGAYVYEALMNVAPVLLNAFSKRPMRPGKYPDRPHPVTQEAIERESEARRKANFERMLAAMEAESKRNYQKEKKEAKSNERND